MGGEVVKFALARENSVDIGLPVEAVFKAITWGEFQEWINYIVINSGDDCVPPYIFDLMDPKANGSIWEMMRPGGEIGFMLMTGLAETGCDALWGVGYARMDPSLPMIPTDGDAVLNSVPRERAAVALRLNPELHAWFQKFFVAIGKPGELPPIGSI